MKAMMRWRPRSGGTLDVLRHEMNDLFQRFLGEPLEGEGATMEAWAPRVDVDETDKEITVKADLPGVDPKEIDISVVEGALVIKGERKEERETKKKNYHQVERFVGQFYRAIALPPGADPDKITASSAKGVVTITIPKKPEMQPKKIAVKAQE